MKLHIYILIIIGLLLSSCSKDDPVYPAPNVPDTLAYVIPKYVYNGSFFAFHYNNELVKVKVLDIECYEASYGFLLEEQAIISGISVDSAYSLGITAKLLADTLILGKEIKMIKGKNYPNYDSWGRLYRFVEIDGMRLDSIMIERKLVLSH